MGRKNYKKQHHQKETSAHDLLEQEAILNSDFFKAPEEKTNVSINSWLAKAKKEIDTLDAELILMYLLRCSDRTELVVHGAKKLNNIVLREADNYLEKRRSGIPLAYILGYKEFYGRIFSVDENVLIPRPETEAAVEYALETLQAASEEWFDASSDPENFGMMFKTNNLLPPQWQVFDIGTGSGCIGVTIWLECFNNKINADVVASDISEKAVWKAGENFAKLSVNDLYDDLYGYEPLMVAIHSLIRARSEKNTIGKFTTKSSDLLDNLDIDPKKPTIVIANLPYLSKKWDWIDKKTLSYEPEEALFAEKNGLELVHKLIDQFMDKIVDKKPDKAKDESMNKFEHRAILILETDKSQQKDVVQYAKKHRLSAKKVSDYVLALCR